ncbi:IS1249 family transposase [Corynebacterium aquilae]|uniref:IS1249 family transposase n=2 Tax=Corynebacterium aquilae TaxID=203263 RepID=UPI000951BD22|nr:IS1249 family transposase [Corynebacterium aquilae]
MPTSPTCPICQSPTKKNGSTSKNRQRWRCKHCGHSFTQTNTAHTQLVRFTLFLSWVQSTQSLADFARHHQLSRRTLQRWFEPFWLIPIPTPTGDNNYDEQVFIDATYFNKQQCLLIASTTNKVLTWHWSHSENTRAYQHLLHRIQRPRLITTDGCNAALSAINDVFPNDPATPQAHTHIQRCLIHIKRNVQRYVTTRPQSNCGKALRALSLKLLKVTNNQQAAQWVTLFHQVSNQYRDWLDEKTYIDSCPKVLIPNNKRKNKHYWYTHDRARSAHRILMEQTRRNHLFAFIEQSIAVIGTDTDSPNTIYEAIYQSSTNSLEGGINSPLKALLHAHRGLPAERQRKLCEWWLLSRTKKPGDLIEIARQHDFGTNQLAKVKTATEALTDSNPTGAPAEYDTGIDTGYTHSIGIRKGQPR